MKKGFTLIELLAVIVILAIIALIATPMILGVIDSAKKGAAESSTYGYIDAIEKSDLKGMIETGDYSTKKDGTYDLSTLTNVAYKGTAPTDVCVVMKDGSVESGSFKFDQYVVDYQNGKAKVNSEKTEVNCDPTVEKTIFDETKGVNVPQLSKGMTPIKWNGTTWVDTSESDTDWYSYGTTTETKNWANARTADGSMWVWIPRYIYKITSGWHSATTGTIEIQFTKNIDDNWNSSVIGNIDNSTGASASNNKWTNHPAFTFGDDEVTGIWVAKFVASGTTSAIDIKPNVASLRSVMIGTIFDASRSMETNERYGWGATGNAIDTHLMKNVEWGAIAYLSKSVYGKDTEVWNNSNSAFKTGCAGSSVSAANETLCNEYHTTLGLNASTTGTIYGVYDMSGGTYEYLAAYVNNGNANLTTNGLNIINAPSKYKDVYQNYASTVNNKGDAIWEISSAATGGTSWYADFSYMPDGSIPWFARGGYYTDTSNAGVFALGRREGSAINYVGFRPVLLVGQGL